MSDSLALVRFPDGEVLAAYLFGDAGAVVPLLVTLDEADARFEGGMGPLMEQMEGLDLDGPEPDDAVDVEIWSAYGAGSWWAGRASRRASLLVDGSDPHGIEYTDMGNPDAPPPREVHDGTPEWVPSPWRDGSGAAPQA